MFVRDKYYGCGTMAEVCLGEVLCMLREGVRSTVMLAEESVASSEIMMMTMAIACTCLE